MEDETVPSPTFGEWLEDQLQERGWSRPRLAKYIEYSPASVTAWIRGVRTPEERACDAIADALGVPRNDVRRLADRPPEFVSSTMHATGTGSASATGEAVTPGSDIREVAQVLRDPRTRLFLRKAGELTDEQWDELLRILDDEEG